MNAETKIPTPAECLGAVRARCRLMLAEVQSMLEAYPMDSRTRGDLNSVRFSLKMILED